MSLSTSIVPENYRYRADVTRLWNAVDCKSRSQFAKLEFVAGGGDTARTSWCSIEVVEGRESMLLYTSTVISMQKWRYIAQRVLHLWIKN